MGKLQNAHRLIFGEKMVQFPPMKTNKCLVAVAFATVTLFAQANEIEKFDPRMAAASAVVDTNGVKWIDGKYLPLEGKCFKDVDDFYDRLPKSVTTNVNRGVRWMKHHTSGMQFRFRTDSKHLHFRWTPYTSNLAMYHMPATGVSGIDVYRYDRKAGRWLYVKTGGIRSGNEGSFGIRWTPGDDCLINLPLYNGIKAFALGIDKEAKVEALGPRKSGINKPVVFYGTSITHGGCASRPGLAFPSIVGRDLDVPIVNLGFSGSGRMELEMSEHLAAIDASCYVLDCLWNMNKPKPEPSAAYHDLYAKGFNKDDNISVVRLRYEPFIRNLRAKRPGVPIVMAEQCDVYCLEPNEKDKFIRQLYEKLIAEGWKNLVYLPKTDMYTGDLEGTVDGCHPNDWGMMSMAKAFGPAVKAALESAK